MKLKEVLHKVNKKTTISISIVGEVVKIAKNEPENFIEYLDFVIVETKPIMGKKDSKNIEKLHVEILPF